MAWGKKFKTLREAKKYNSNRGFGIMGIKRIGKPGHVYRYWVGTHLEWLQR